MNEEIQIQSQEQLGLTPEQQQQAIDLRNNVLDAQDRVYDVKWMQRDLNSDIQEGGSDPLVDLVGKAVTNELRFEAEHKLNRAERVASRHYKRNESAYQEQAELEAVRDGKEINR